MSRLSEEFTPPSTAKYRAETLWKELMTQKKPKSKENDQVDQVAWIRTVAETEASGYVKNIYEGFKKQRGWIPNILKSTTIRSDLTRGWITFFTTLMYGPSGLKRAQREMLAVVVSVVNHCYY